MNIILKREYISIQNYAVLFLDDLVYFSQKKHIKLGWLSIEDKHPFVISGGKLWKLL